LIFKHLTVISKYILAKPKISELLDNWS